MRDLLVLSCSARKTSAPGKLPAIVRYDGPAFRVLRSFLREYCWPGSLSVAVLSARYGLIGGLSHIEWYDQRMTVARSQELAPSVREILAQWSPLHRRVQLVLGKDYLHCLDFFSPPLSEVDVEPAAGAIGRKLQHLKVLLGAIGTQRRRAVDPIPCLHRPLYFLPDWDDFLDLDYAFALDRFSAGSRADRNEGHPISMMRPRRLCDGVVVSLAQHFSSRGFLRPSPMENEASLSPRSVRRRFDLRKDQWAFGDCGAFSYVNDELPPISVEHAVSVYDIYDFDLGASVDHIPVAEIRGRTKRVLLSDSERQWRVTLTRDNADKFIRHREKIGARFIPVGAIQGLTAKDYAAQVGPYLDMGYRHIGLGGLVPRSDGEILEVVEAVYRETKRTTFAPWIHLFGVFRPNLQAQFRALGVNSFDSASYFRKAWLRSGQNYLSADGRWYAAIRVPPSHDPQVRARLLLSGVSLDQIQRLERRALQALRKFDQGRKSIDECLDAVLNYDRLLLRGQKADGRLISAYRETLESRPWQFCDCPMCQSLGIEIVLFRGLNRNKRRGAHNTLWLFRRASMARKPRTREGG